ncbi:MAG: flippase [Candidatus Aminicenantia bacterium]
MKRSHIIIRNSFYNLLVPVWLLILNFISLPYIVRKLGEDSYGIFAIVSTVVGYFTFLNLGLGTAIQKYISEYYAKKEFEVIRKIVSNALAVYGMMGMVGAIIITFLTKFLVYKALNIPADLHSIAEFAFYVSAIGFLFSMPLSVFFSIPRSLQRFDIPAKLSLIIITLQILLTVFLLYLGYSLKEIVVLNIVANIVNFLLLLIISKKLMPELVINPSFDLKVILKLFKYSGFVSITNITKTFAVQFDRFIIGLFLPISQLTYYVVPYNFARKLWLVPKNIVPVMLPVVSELSTFNENKLIKELYLRSTKYISAAVIPVSAVIIIFSRELLSYWMGASFAAKSTLTLQILTFSFFISTLGWTSVVVAQGMNRPDIPAFFHFGQAVVNVFLCILLVPRIGIEGAAIAFGLNHIIFIPVFVYVIAKKLVGISLTEFIIKSFLSPIVLTVLIIPLAVMIKPFISSLLALALAGLAAMIIYFVLFYFFVFDHRDKNILFDYLAKIRNLKALNFRH